MMRKMLRVSMVQKMLRMMVIVMTDDGDDEATGSSKEQLVAFRYSPKAQSQPQVQQCHNHYCSWLLGAVQVQTPLGTPEVPPKSTPLVILHVHSFP